MTMLKLARAVPVVLTLALTACTGEQNAAQNMEQNTAQNTACDPSALDKSVLDSIQSGVLEDVTAENQLSLSQALIPCLSHPDSSIRDDLAYATLTTIYRGGSLSVDSVQAQKQELYDLLDAEDPSGFGAPFAALVLSEVARIDRVSPYLSEVERSDMVQRAADYVSSVDDYRGFSDQEGWRHGVAHGADWLMQLSLNRDITPQDRLVILGAITDQVQARHGHSYIYGEAGRLARPLLFLAARDIEDQAIWSERIAALSNPAPLTDWSEAFHSEDDLARLHNLRAFLGALWVNISLSENEGLQALKPGVQEALRNLP